jgi:hypothetical protein
MVLGGNVVVKPDCSVLGVLTHEPAEPLAEAEPSKQKRSQSPPKVRSV